MTTAFATILWIGIGATVGASMRYYLNQLIHNYPNLTLPYGTLSANIIGCFLAGIITVLILEKLSLHDSYNYKLVFIVRLTGSLTTMSAMSLKSIEIINTGNYMTAFVNILLNVVLSLLAVGAGITLTKYIFKLWH